MKRIIYYLFISMLFWNCAHQITRTGYQVKKSDYKYCNVVIQKFSIISDEKAKKIGEIELGESGFSTSCSEVEAIEILKGEACAINANLIVIIEEKRPDFWSSCYRCKAEFYSYHLSNSTNPVVNDQDYNQEEIMQRISDDKSRNATNAVFAVIAGLIFGFLLF